MTSNNGDGNATTTSSSRKHYEAIQWNNIAVNDLEKSQLEDALTNFRRALVLSKQSLAESRLHYQQAQDDWKKRSGSIDDLVISSVSLPDDGNVTGSTTNAASSYIHRQAISVPMPEENVGPDHHSCLILSTVILFNIALTNHLLAEEEEEEAAMMTTVRKQQQGAFGSHYHDQHHHLQQLQQIHDERRACFLSRSIQLYEMVNRVLSDRKNQLNSPLLMLVTINNIGVACQSLGDKNRANQAFEYLLSTMFLLSERCEKSSHSGQQGRSSGIPFNLTERFIRNVSYLMTTTCTAPAA